MTVVKGPAFGELVRRYRRAADLTQEELAERATLSVRAISDLERGLKHRPHNDTVQLLADALGLTGAEREAFQRAGRCLAEQRHVRPIIPPTNLPHDLTPFIGRKNDIAALARLVEHPAHRLVAFSRPRHRC